MNATGLGIAVDRVWWLGWSTYYPVWYPTDRGGPFSDARGNNTFDILVNNGTANNGLCKLIDGVWGQQSAHLTNPHELIFEYKVNPNAVTKAGATETQVVIAEIDDLKGHWVNFALRCRENPFTTTTNANTIGTDALQGINHVFTGGSGILELHWKLDTDSTWNNPVNVTGPVGLVPIANRSRVITFRQYKHSWLRLMGSPAWTTPNPPAAKAAIAADLSPTSTVDDPIYTGFGEIYFGYEDEGTFFADVKPG